MAKEIKLIVKGGKVKVLAKGASAQEAASFTEKLSKELGEIEERHKGGHYNETQQDQQLKQKT